MNLNKPHAGGVAAGKSNGDDTGSTERALVGDMIDALFSIVLHKDIQDKDFCIGDVHVLSEGQPR